MEYAATAWDPNTKKNINKLEGVQRSAARYILRNYERKPGTVTQHLDQLEFESLADRRKQLRLTLLFKIVDKLVDIPHYLLTAAQRSQEEVKV